MGRWPEPRKCPYCKKEYKSKKCYRDHTRGHRKELGHQKRIKENYLKVLHRDEYCCVLCGIETFNKMLIVHHINGNVVNNRMNNLITICKPCHAELHGQTLAFKSPRVDIVLELRWQGKTYQEISNYLGISRQRVHQITKRYKDKKLI